MSRTGQQSNKSVGSKNFCILGAVFTKEANEKGRKEEYNPVQNNDMEKDS